MAPVLFSTSQIALWISQSPQIAEAAAGPMALGSSAVSAYALAFASILPAVSSNGTATGGSIALTCICAWVIAVVSTSIPSFMFMQHLRKRQAFTTEAISSQVQPISHPDVDPEASSDPILRQQNQSDAELTPILIDLSSD